MPSFIMLSFFIVNVLRQNAVTAIVPAPHFYRVLIFLGGMTIKLLLRSFSRFAIDEMTSEFDGLKPFCSVIS
jgi:hypothetical protein